MESLQFAPSKTKNSTDKHYVVHSKAVILSSFLPHPVFLHVYACAQPLRVPRHFLDNIILYGIHLCTCMSIYVRMLIHRVLVHTHTKRCALARM